MKHIFTFLFICLGIATYTKSQNPELQNPATSNSIHSLKPVADTKDLRNLKIVHDTLIADMLSHISSDSILSYIQHLQGYGSRFLFSPGHKNISLWLQNKLMSFGYTNVVLDSFLVTDEWPFGSGTIVTNWQYNVVAEMTGTVNPGISYVIGGHYDAIIYPNGDPYTACPGADDNASGTAATLEIARVLKEQNFSFPATVRFVLFDAEELGLYGSFHYVEEILSGTEKPEIMFNMDMIGNEPSDSAWNLQLNNYLGFEWIGGLASQVAAEYTSLSILSSTYNESIGSDSDPFFLAGLPAIFLQEDIFSPYYHQLSDVDTNINEKYCAEVARVACGMLMESSLAPLMVDFEIFNPGEGQALIPRWLPSPENNIATYRVYFGSAPLTYDSVYTTSDTAMIFAGLEADTLYYFSVSAVNTEGRESMKYELSDAPALTSFDQGILIVDDSEGGYYNPSDSTVDAYYRNLCGNFPVTEYDATQNGPVTLSLLGKYSSVVWHINKINIVPKLRNSIVELKQYMQLGGNVLFTVFQPARMFEYTTDLQHTWGEGSFLHDMLKIDSTRYKSSAAFIGSLPLVTGYTMMDVDTTKTYSTYNYHLPYIEALYPSAEGTAVYSFDTDYDSLTANGSMKGMPVGVEYRGDYNTVLLSFPLYYMDSIHAKAVMQYILTDVFGEPVAIEEENQESAPVNVFPNPSQGTFVVRTNGDVPQQQAMVIYDVTGRQVFSVAGLSGDENRISTSGLQHGIYFLKVTCGNQAFNFPLIIVE